MRCPVCDFDPEIGLDNQSMFFQGLSFDVPPNPYVDDNGKVNCSCFNEGEFYDDELSEDETNEKE